MPDKETQNAPTLLQKAGYYGYKALNVVLKLCNVRFIAVVGRAAGYVVWICSASRRRIVARNLRIVVDPSLKQGKLRAMVRRNIARTCMNLACSLKTGLMTEREAQKSIRMSGAAIFEEHGMNGHTVISCIPHAGNWEVLARIRPYFTNVEHFGSMYRRLSNPLLEKLVYKSRTHYGCEMFSKENGLRAVMKLARTGGLLGVLSDQFTQEGLFLPYFGKITGVTPLPALLYKRCRGKATLFSVFTRNTALGKWEAELGRIISLPPDCNTYAEITLHINRALEQCQKENILDGFWMHHRWKSTAQFAPPQDGETQTVAEQNYTLPFRIIVCMPEKMEEALCLFPALRVLKASRCDAQLTVLCPVRQQAFWASQRDIVAHTVSTDGAQPIAEQFEAEEIYREGPFDILFMFREEKSILRGLKPLFPLFVSGFRENKLSSRFRASASGLHTGKPWHAANDYLQLLRNAHSLDIDRVDLTQKLQGNEQADATYIAPLSTLGEADAWPPHCWKQLVEKLNRNVVMLVAAEGEEKRQARLLTRIEQWKTQAALDIEHRIVQPEDLSRLCGSRTTIYATDGLIPQIAALYGAQTTVIMASRLAERYAPLGANCRVLFRHSPCHPCYRKTCDSSKPCTSFLTVDNVLGWGN